MNRLGLVDGGLIQVAFGLAGGVGGRLTKRSGNCGWYFKFLNWLSENGLSLDVCGRLCERVTPRSASSSAVALAFIGAPRSACSVSWPYGTRCFAIAASSNGLNRAA